jgi:hypothetical protein
VNSWINNLKQVFEEDSASRNHKSFNILPEKPNKEIETIFKNSNGNP